MADSLAAALAELQANPPTIRKRAKGQHGNYADLPAVAKALRPELERLGLLWQTWPDVISVGDAKPLALWWRLTHVTSGETMSGIYPIHATDPQRAGSEITYARRYALVTVTGVTPEGDDDDGQRASRPERTPAKVTGAEHERLRYGTVEATPEDRPAERGPVDNSGDLWTDQPAGQLPVQQLPEERPGTIDRRQRSRIMAKIGKMPHDTRAAWLTEATGREIGSTNDLSWVEADSIIRGME